MCAIIGALLRNGAYGIDEQMALSHILHASRARGRDGIGVTAINSDIPGPTLVFQHRHAGKYTPADASAIMHDLDNDVGWENIIFNLRAEPTTEFVLMKEDYDQQPYSMNGWNIVHNGTIANDAKLRTYGHPTNIDSAAIIELLALNEVPKDIEEAFYMFKHVIGRLVGSYSILASHTVAPHLMFAAANYKPLWYAATSRGLYFTSSKDYFPVGMVPQALEPYSAGVFGIEEDRVLTRIETLRPNIGTNKVLVIASGGLDSTVVAAQLIEEGFNVELLHFSYGCRAGTKEEEAVRNIASALNVPVTFLPMGIYGPHDSKLFDKESAIAGGEEGAEFAHEWVPARNLVMLSIATALAEARGFNFIALGNNLEEAGAYPDNEPEFIRRFNTVLPFAVADGKQVQVMMPVGDLMKHEIVALGYANKAPMHLTWSCYRNGEKHCGTCGPCYMRRTAFEINNIPEVIEYYAHSN